MACKGAHCDSHGTGISTCSNHRGSCSTNRPFVPSGGFGSSGSTITAADIDQLRGLIREELDSYNLHSEHDVSLSEEGSYNNETLIDNTHINQMEQMVYDTNVVKERIGYDYQNFYPTDTNAVSASSYEDEATIRATHWNTLRDKYNIMREDCICNSDCACNLVCNCHNNCGCNYSDLRLKENIQFLENKNELNWYSFNYIWDKNKKYIGVMAQEVLKTKYRNAVKKDLNGFYMVNYSLLSK